jgi:hypothetical protein
VDTRRKEGEEKGEGDLHLSYAFSTLRTHTGTTVCRVRDVYLCGMTFQAAGNGSLPPPPPYPFPQRPSGESHSHQLFYSRGGGVYNPFFLTQRSPILQSNFIYSSPPLPSPLKSSSSCSLQSKSMFLGLESSPTSTEEIPNGIMIGEQSNEEGDYEYSLEMNPAWIERLSNTMKKMKKKKKKRYPSY